MPIDALPPFPDRGDPNFSTLAGTALGALPNFVNQANALEQSLQLAATTGTSSTALSIGTGSRTLTTQPGKAWVVGAWVYIAYAPNPSVYMYGQVTAYNASTGALSVNVTWAVDTGNLGAWIIGLSVPMDGSPVFSGTVTARTGLTVQANGAHGSIKLEPGNSVKSGYVEWYLPSGSSAGFIGYAEAGGYIEAYAYGTLYYQFNVPPRCGVDATSGTQLVRKSQMDAAVAAVVRVGGFRNLSVSSTGANAQVLISADALMLLNANGEGQLVAPSVTASTSSSGVNGLDAGTIATNTWYSVWVISNGTTTAALLSTSATTPSLPSGYSYKARVGWIRTDGTGNKYPLAFAQKGRRAQWLVAPGTNLTAQLVMASGVQGNVTTGTWVSVAVAGFVPPTGARIHGAVANSTGPAGTTMAHPNGNAGAYTSLTNPPAASVRIGVASRTITPFDFLLESGNIYYAADQADSRMYAHGWEDNL